MAAHSPEMSGRITALVRKNKKFILYIQVNEQKPKNHGEWTIQSVNLVYETNDGCKLVSQEDVETSTRSFVLSCGEDGEISMTLSVTRTEIKTLGKQVTPFIRIVFHNGSIQYTGDVPFQFEGMQSSERWTKLDCTRINEDFQGDDSGILFGSSVDRSKLDCAPIDFESQGDDSSILSASSVDLSDLDTSAPPIGQDMNTLTLDQLRFRDPYHIECTHKLCLRVPFTNLIRPLLLSH
eukprot:TRINITY_DN3629_c0_g1_i2.p1 TRINITY_DN3629_c0_g1~~TRINITY_DN3629_c0_g1_i2.p1  ORF type:complete len:237 (-),score=9.23 TRINITY_DN3629_c0_g1_i2:342-1052(-)